jgi:hypothetical protein
MEVLMNKKNLLVCALLCASVTHVQTKSLGEKLDGYWDTTKNAMYYLTIRAKFAAGIIPPLTRANIEKHPEYKQEYIIYALRHPSTTSPLVWTKLYEKYPEDLKHIASVVFDQKIEHLKEKWENLINK